MKIIGTIRNWIERALWRYTVNQMLNKLKDKEIDLAEFHDCVYGRSSRAHGYDLNQVNYFLKYKHKRRNKKNAK